jgi:hypothetical protein
MPMRVLESNGGEETLSQSSQVMLGTTGQLSPEGVLYGSSRIHTA